MLKTEIKTIIAPMLQLNMNEEGNIDTLVGVIYRDIVLKIEKENAQCCSG